MKVRNAVYDLTRVIHVPELPFGHHGPSAGFRLPFEHAMRLPHKSSDLSSLVLRYRKSVNATKFTPIRNGRVLILGFSDSRSASNVVHIIDTQSTHCIR